MQVIKIETHDEVFVDTFSTFKQGTIQAKRSQLEKAFKSPMTYLPEDGMKTSTQWELKFTTPNGCFVATIYDWKRPQAPEQNEMITWSIGGHYNIVVELVHQAFRRANKLALQYA